MSEAGVIVKEALRRLPVPVLPFDPDAVGTRLVAMTYSSSPDLFDGKRGGRPHRMATAAVALASGLHHDEFEFPIPAKECVFLALGNVLLDAGANAQRYRFGPIDTQLLTLAEKGYLDFDAQQKPAQDAVLGTLDL